MPLSREMQESSANSVEKLKDQTYNVTDRETTDRATASSDEAGFELENDVSDREKENVNVVATATIGDDEHPSDDHVVVTGADVAAHLLSLRDDKDPAVTFRGMLLATMLAGFLATLQQIYTFKPTYITLSGTFIVILAHFLGKAWAEFLPRGDIWEARWRARGGQGSLPIWIKLLSFFNYGPWGLKEHAVASITATSASNAAASSFVFAASKLFYDMPLNASTVILSTISIGLFGYGLCGLMRPICVWHVESVYWSNLPIVKSLQGLHWHKVKNSKPLRYFWYAYASMTVYEILPAYMWPWLNSISIPCLASMRATGSTGSTLTNLFGGAENNEGLGLFNLGFDWQYITSSQTSLPLKYQVNAALGFLFCYIAMIVIYYGNIWNARSLPFMSTELRTASGGVYPISKVFVGGVLDEQALEQHGIPRLTGSFAWAMFMANTAIGALIAHCILFWGKDVVNTYRSARKGRFDDRHHAYMEKNYRECPWYWYAGVLVVSFALGLVVVLKDNIHLPVWAYIVSLLLGTIMAPFSTLLYGRYGNGIATNNLSKMVAGLLVPGRPVANMYFAAWSHTVISNALNLSADLKMGEYLKIPPRVMFLTQIWGTIFGGFVNYVVMIAIVDNNKALLRVGNGNASWSGATMQGYNTNATSWALAKYLYKIGGEYYMVPFGMLIGAALVVVHRVLVIWIPRIKSVRTDELNLAQFIQYAGFIPYDQPQTCIIFNLISTGFFVQYYLRNYRPRIFKDYSYLVTAAFDGGSLTTVFILSFAVFGAGGKSVPFPDWWGNNVKGNYDFCPTT